jgi:AcrR family transcriptional regulator
MTLADTLEIAGPRTGRRRAGRPSTGEAQGLERAVLDAALAEFRTHGFSGASIDRIARVAGITRSAIYRRYTDRQSLFRRVIDEQIALLEGQAGVLMNAVGDPMQALRQTMEAYCRFVVSPVALDLQRIVVWEAAASAEVDMPRIPALPTDLADPLDRLIVQAQAAGQIRPGPVDLWRDVLLRLVAEGPRWEALASGEPWDETRLKADFERMWPMFLTLAGRGD